MFYPWDICCLIEFKNFKMGSMFYPWDLLFNRIQAFQNGFYVLSLGFVV